MADTALESARASAPADARVAAAEALGPVAATLHARGWTPATSSNFSVRLDAGHCVVTVSGGDKARIGPEQLMVVDLDGRPVHAAPGARPSAEAGLHRALYRRDPAVGAVLHTHAPNAVLAARLAGADRIVLEDYELLKAFAGVTTHATRLEIPVVPNDQDIDALAAAADARLDAAGPGCPAYLIAGHGVYAWGADLAEALRHLEALDYLLGLELELRRHGTGALHARITEEGARP
jgi:methylthioribulose-1-phosphate dehydratase